MASPEESSQPSQGSMMTVVDENRQEILYFAYGSNLSLNQMRHRCPFATPVGLAHLENWKWFINTRGYANVVQLAADASRKSTAAASSSDHDGGVYGMLYLLPPDDEDMLDEYEGVPWAYQKFQTEVRWVRDDQGRGKSEVVRALVYVDIERVTEGAAGGEYVGRMEQGIEEAMEWGLREDYVERVMRRFWRV